MKPSAQSLKQMEADSPIPLLTRRKLLGQRMLMAHIRMETGCHVSLHRHPSEQMTFVVSGSVRWSFGEPDTEDFWTQEVSGGSLICTPGGVWHQVDALEDSVVVDILSPPGMMGIDTQV